jgi:RNA binding exosome subunit
MSIINHLIKFYSTIVGEDICKINNAISNFIKTSNEKYPELDINQLKLYTETVFFGSNIQIYQNETDKYCLCKYNFSRIANDMKFNDNDLKLWKHSSNKIEYQLYAFPMTESTPPIEAFGYTKYNETIDNGNGKIFFDNKCEFFEDEFEYYASYQWIDGMMLYVGDENDDMHIVYIIAKDNTILSAFKDDNRVFEEGEFPTLGYIDEETQHLIIANYVLNSSIVIVKYNP